MHRKEKKEKKIERITTGTVTSKEGFAIADPCYVLSDNVYYDFWGKKKKFADGVFDYEGSSFAIAGTAYGDGVYYDNHDHEYPVDAGVIALIPLELVSDKSGLNSGAVIQIPGKAEFVCEDGVFDITFSNGYSIHINTKLEDSDCDSDADDDEEYGEYIGEDDDEYDDEYSDCEDDCDDEYRASYEDSEDFECYGYREYTNDPDDDDYEE